MAEKVNVAGKGHPPVQQEFLLLQLQFLRYLKFLLQLLSPLGPLEDLLLPLLFRSTVKEWSSEAHVTFSFLACRFSQSSWSPTSSSSRLSSNSSLQVSSLPPLSAEEPGGRGEAEGKLKTRGMMMLKIYIREHQNRV